MKIKLDIEATPQELRVFFGLPDIEPLQKEMIEAIRRNMAVGMEGFEPLTIMKPFLPEQMQSLTAMQKAFWQSMMKATHYKTDDKHKSDNDTND